MMISEKKILEIVGFFLENDEKTTLETFNITSETFSRYKRIYKKVSGDENLKKKNIIKKLFNNYSEQEINAIADGGRFAPGYDKVPVINFSGKRIRFAHITDTHIGSKYFQEKVFDKVVKEIKKQDVEIVMHTGDIVDGMLISGKRGGTIYELTHLGYEHQKEYAIEQFKKLGKKIFCVDGNHDRWYLQQNGAGIVKDIANSVPDMEYLGHDEGDVNLNGCVIKLWHGEDGNSYATSYRIQKVVEAFTGGEKPNVLLLGHTHKMLYMYERHIHCLSGGSISLQSKWMRSKRIPAHTGFWIVDVWISKGCVKKIQPTWYPFYM